MFNDELLTKDLLGNNGMIQEGRNQFVVFWEFVKILFSLRIRNCTNIVLIIIAFGFSLCLQLPDRSSPYTKPDLPSPSFYQDLSEWDTIRNLIYYSFDNILFAPKNALVDRIIQFINPECELFQKDTQLEIQTFVQSSPMRSLGFYISQQDGHSINYDVYTNSYLYSSSTQNILFRDHIHYIQNISTSFSSGYFYDKYYGLYYSTGALFAVLFNFSVLFILIYSAQDMINLREKRLFLLLTISGSREVTLWLSIFFIDYIKLIVLCLVYSIVGSMSQSIQPISIPFLFLMLLVYGSSIYCLVLAIVPIVYKSNYFKYLSITLIIISLFLPIYSMVKSFDPQNRMEKATIEKLCLFFPQMGPIKLFQAIDYCIVMNMTLGWNTMNIITDVKFSQCLLFSSLSSLLYFSIFVFFILFMPRSAGCPPIGFMNLFSLAHWKRLFIQPTIQRDVGNSSPLINVYNINKTYSGSTNVQALKDVSFSIDIGEIILLIGPNGCGKSTLLNSMTGTIEADSGDLDIYGRHSEIGFSALQDCVGICFQDNVFFDQLSIYQHLSFFGKIRGSHGITLENEISLLCSKLNIGDILDMKAETLSGGQKRKLCIAMAFIGSPSLVILDEPTAGIDVSTRQTIWKAISLFHETTCLVTTHSLEEAESVSSRLFVMKSAEMIFMGTSSELRRQTSCGYRLSLIGDNPDCNKALEYIKSVLPDSNLDPSRPNTLLVPVDRKFISILEYLDANKSEFQIQDFNVIVESLENVLIRIIAEGDTT